MPSITPNTKVSIALYPPHTQEKVSPCLLSLLTQVKCLALSLSLSHTQEICVTITWPLSLAYTKKGPIMPLSPPIHKEQVYPGLYHPIPKGSVQQCPPAFSTRKRSTNALADKLAGSYLDGMDGYVDRWKSR